MNRIVNPHRGEIWLVNLDPTIGHEQAKVRPCLIISHDTFNNGWSGLVIIIPITSRERNIPSHIEIDGLPKRSFILCEQLRTVDKKRLGDKPLGLVTDNILRKVEFCLRNILDL